MCFYNDDCDWIAQVYEESASVVTESGQCQECGRIMLVGATMHNVWIQQYEACRRCDPNERAEWDDDFAGGPLEQCSDGQHDYGETFDYSRCDDCDLFLQAVQEAEEDAGCHHDDARPPLEFMRERINDGGQDEAKRYWRKALERYPQLKASGYLGWLWREVFGN